MNVLAHYFARLRRPIPSVAAISITTWFYIGLVIFLAVQLLIRLAISRSLEPDDADLALFGQTLAWGYSEQPPLYSWLVYAASQIMGMSILTLTIVKSAILGILMIAIYESARRLDLSEKHSLYVVYGVILIPSFSWHAVSYLTHSLLLCTMAMLTLHRLICVRQRGYFIDYLLFGIVVGFGMLSKYNYLYFFAALFIASAATPGYRTALLNWRLTVSILIAISIVVPHGMWVLQHWEHVWGSLAQKTGATQARSVGLILSGFINLGMNLILSLLMFVITLWWAFRPRLSRFAMNEHPHEPIQLLNGYFLAIFAILSLQIMIGGTSKFHERWIQPLLLVVPLWVMMRLQFMEVFWSRAWRYVLITGIALMAITATRFVQIWSGGRDDGIYPMQMNFDALVAEVESLDEQPTIVASDRVLAGNLALRLPHAKVWCIHHHAFALSPLPDTEIIAVWHHNWGTTYPIYTAEYVNSQFGFYFPAGSANMIDVPGTIADRPVNHFGVQRLQKWVGMVSE